MFNCFYCGVIKNYNESSAEHIVTESIGGSIVTSKVCSSCNRRANQEIDEKFKDQWPINWERALKGLPDKHGRATILKQRAITSQGIQIELELSKNRIKPLTLPKVNREGDLVTVEVDPRYYDRVTIDLKKKMNKLGKSIEFPPMEELFVQSDDSVVTTNHEIDLVLIRREQIKITLGMGCLAIENFSRSETATILRQYLWNDFVPAIIPGIKGNLYPVILDESPPRLFMIDEPTVRSIFEDGKEMAFLIHKENHSISIYPWKGHIRIMVSMFGRIHSVINTIEPITYFWPGPIPPPKGFSFVLDPVMRTSSKIDIGHTLDMVGSFEAAHQAGDLSSRHNV